MTKSVEDSSLLIEQALAASQVGDTECALVLLTRAASEQPSSGIPHFLMGSEYAALGQIAQAEAAFSNAVLLAPHLPVARYQLGLLQYSSGRVPAALVTWQPLLELGEGSPMQHWVRGFGALAQDQLDAAKAHFERGVQLNLDNLPMSADILKIVREIDAVQSSPSADPASVASGPPADDAEASAHFLVTNYGRQGPLH